MYTYLESAQRARHFDIYIVYIYHDVPPWRHDKTMIHGIIDFVHMTLNVQFCMGRSLIYTLLLNSNYKSVKIDAKVFHFELLVLLEAERETQMLIIIQY